MASKYLQKFPIPAGFQQILSDFTREVLRDQPKNIIEYAANYFEMLERGNKFQFNSKYNVGKDDKKYQLAYNPKNAEEITKKASSITAKINQGNTHPSVAPVSSHSVSGHESRGVGTEKTVTGQQTSNYVNNLSANIANDQQEEDNKEEMMRNAVQQTVDKLFQKIDIDSNGYLSSNQIQRFVDMMSEQMGEGVQFKGEDIGQFIAMVDNDKDGKISRQQLGDFMLGLLMLVS